MDENVCISRWRRRELHTQKFGRSRLSSENTYQKSGRSRFQLLVLSSYLHASCVTIITVIYFTIFYELNKNCLLSAPKPERSRGMAVAPRRRDAPLCLVRPHPLALRALFAIRPRQPPSSSAACPLPPRPPSPAGLAPRLSLFCAAPACCTLDE